MRGVVAYQADIVIAVKGATQLTNLQKQIEATSNSINKVNKQLTSQGLLGSSISNLQKVVAQSSQAMRNATTGTTAQKQAIDTYVKSLDAAQTAETNLQKAIERRRRELGLATAETGKATNRQRSGLGKDISGRLSSAAIGGAFPLLFGQSPQAAVGGALGGLIGGQAGGFAGSLIGTALGELSAAQERIKTLGAELGFTKTQAGELAKAFELAGRNSDQLQAAITNIQGLGLSTQETASAIKISNELAEEYGGKVDKIAQAFANTLESGKVSISTLNSFTAQGIPIQEKLAEKLNVSRTTLLEMAKDGKISVQQVIDVLVDMGREAEKTANKSRSGFDSFSAAVKGLGTAIANAAGVILKNLVPALNTVLTRLAQIIQQATIALSKLGDIQVGKVYGAVAGSGFFRGIFAGGKSNIDSITKALNQLDPALARNSEDIAKYRKAVAAADTELGKFKGAAGEYAVNTAQRRITVLQGLINARERALPREPVTTTTPIIDIAAPAQLAAGGGGGGAGKKDEAADNLRRAQELLKTLEQQTALLQTKNELDKDILKISQDYQETLDRISDLEDQSLRTKLEDQAVRLRNQQINAAVEEHEKKVSEELDKQVEKYKELDSVRRTAFEGYKNAEIVALQDLTAKAELVKLAFDSIGQSFSNSVTQVVSGATTIQQAVADMFAAIGRALVDYATQAIATYVAIGIARMFAGITGVQQANYTGNEMGGIFNNPTFGVDSSGLAGPSNPLSQLNYAGVRFATGGFVTSPTRAIVGEGGEPEYVIPSSKMRGAMSRYASGARGSSVIPQNGDGAMAGGGGTFTLETVVINNVEYATVDQVRAMGQQAASQGAQGGFNKSMRTLQNSRSQRARIGLR